MVDVVGKTSVDVARAGPFGIRFNGRTGREAVDVGKPGPETMGAKSTSGYPSQWRLLRRHWEQAGRFPSHYVMHVNQWGCADQGVEDLIIREEAGRERKLTPSLRLRQV